MRLIYLIYINILTLSNSRQTATPTLLGYQFMVHHERLTLQMIELTKSVDIIQAKFGGATGNFNAHYVAYPNIDWRQMGDNFIKKLNLKRSKYTSQVDGNDTMCAVFDALKRINTICIDFCQDLWLYLCQGYFKMKPVSAKAIGIVYLLLAYIN